MVGGRDRETRRGKKRKNGNLPKYRTTRVREGKRKVREEKKKKEGKKSQNRRSEALTFELQT